jgi:hypothetical protein
VDNICRDRFCGDKLVGELRVTPQRVRDALLALSAPIRDELSSRACGLGSRPCVGLRVDFFRLIETKDATDPCALFQFFVLHGL